MTIKEVKQLHNGDEVFWSDPDDGICSRTITIQSIKIDAPNEIISIYGNDGDYLQCFAHELS